MTGQKSGRGRGRPPKDKRPRIRTKYIQECVEASPTDTSERLDKYLQTVEAEAARDEFKAHKGTVTVLRLSACDEPTGQVILVDQPLQPKSFLPPLFADGARPDMFEVKREVSQKLLHHAGKATDLLQRARETLPEEALSLFYDFGHEMALVGHYHEGCEALRAGAYKHVWGRGRCKEGGEQNKDKKKEPKKMRRQR